jgi:hypothetical protein
MKKRDGHLNLNVDEVTSCRYASTKYLATRSITPRLQDVAAALPDICSNCCASALVPICSVSSSSALIRR